MKIPQGLMPRRSFVKNAVCPCEIITDCGLLKRSTVLHFSLKRAHFPLKFTDTIQHRGTKPPMKKLTSTLFFSAFLSTSLALASNCDLSNALNFSAYAIDSMTLGQSDFQGLTGAGNTISAKNFHFGPLMPFQCGLSVSVGNHFQAASGRSDGFIEVTNPGGTYDIAQGGYRNFDYPGIHGSQFVHHPTVARHIHDLSVFYKSLPNSGVGVQVVKNTLTLQLPSTPIQVVTLREGQINTSRNIEISGTSMQTLILNIPGKEVNLSGLMLKVNGLYIRNIIWNFYEATSLRISRLGGLNSTLPEGDEWDRTWGMQGFVIAPQATVTLSATKITGSLLAANIRMGVGPTGQINLPPAQGTPSPCLTIEHPECRVELRPVTPPTPAPKPN